MSFPSNDRIPKVGEISMKTQKQATHTPTPWTAEIINNWPESQEKANQEFMLRAVNAHDELVEDLAVMFQCFGDKLESAMRERIQRHLQAIAKVEGK